MPDMIKTTCRLVVSPKFKELRFDGWDIIYCPPELETYLKAYLADPKGWRDVIYFLSALPKQSVGVKAKETGKPKSCHNCAHWDMCRVSRDLAEIQSDVCRVTGWVLSAPHFREIYKLMASNCRNYQREGG